MKDLVLVHYTIQSLKPSLSIWYNTCISIYEEKNCDERLFSLCIMCISICTLTEKKSYKKLSKEILFVFLHYREKLLTLKRQFLLISIFAKYLTYVMTCNLETIFKGTAPA